MGEVSECERGQTGYDGLFAQTLASAGGRSLDLITFICPTSYLGVMPDR